MTYEPYPPPPEQGPPPGYYQQPPPTPPQQSKGIGITAMVLGIIAVLLAFIPIIGLVSFLLGLVAIGLGIYATVKYKGRGQGIAGTITGGVALIVALVVTLFTGAIFSIVEEEMRNNPEFYDTELEELLEDADTDVNATDADADEVAGPNSPYAHSALTIIGDEDALPEGEDGEVSIVAIDQEETASFAFVLQNRTDEVISRVDVSGRAYDKDDETLGSGSAYFVSPSVVEPGGYAIGYIYVDTSETSLPEGSTIPDVNIDYVEGIDPYESIIGLDIENVEELSSGDLTGDVSNPHDIPVEGPFSIETVCISKDDKVLHDEAFADRDSLESGDSTTWTLSFYRAAPDCEVRLLSASGYDF